MGHLINPISTRLGLNSFWLSSWVKYETCQFHYDLSVDNNIKSFVLWLFSDSRVAVQLSIIGIFLSHFKIIKRSNQLVLSIYLILNSLKFLKSQSVEVDSSLAAYKLEILQLRETIQPKNINYHTNQKFLATKSFVTNFISLLLTNNLSHYFKLNPCFNSYDLVIDFSFLNKSKFVNAKFISRFISRRLSFGFELNKVLQPIVLDLTNLVTLSSSKLSGFKIACSGRFNKTQMASYTWEKYGPICLNTFTASVDYSLSRVFLRYGLCGVKVWLFNTQLPFKSYKNNLVSILLNKNIYTGIFSRRFTLTNYVNVILIYSLIRSFFVETIIKDFLLKEHSNSFILFLQKILLFVVILKN